MRRPGCAAPASPRSVAAIACVLALAGACGKPTDIYVGRDEPLDGTGAVELPEPPPAAGAQAEQPVMAFDAGAAPSVGPPAVVVDAGAGASAPLVCGPALEDCDGDPGNGCETDVRRDPAHCGACDTPCGFPDCACEDGVPVLRCPAGRDDCDGDPGNGCEVDVRSDATHCGACDRRCHADGREARAARCEAGACLLECDLTWADCDGDPDNGCEVSTWIDSNNCGACGVVCTCHDGRCL